MWRRAHRENIKLIESKAMTKFLNDDDTSDSNRASVYPGQTPAVEGLSTSLATAPSTDSPASYDPNFLSMRRRGKRTQRESSFIFGVSHSGKNFGGLVKDAMPPSAAELEQDRQARSVAVDASADGQAPPTPELATNIDFVPTMSAENGQVQNPLSPVLNPPPPLPNSLGSPEVPLESSPLSTTHTRQPQQSSPTQYFFHLQSPEKTYWLRTGSQKELDRWLAALESVIGNDVAQMTSERAAQLRAGTVHAQPLTYSSHDDNGDEATGMTAAADTTAVTPRRLPGGIDRRASLSVRHFDT